MKRRKPTAVRRARATVVAFLLATAIAVLGLSASLETVRPEWREPEYGHKLHQLRQRTDDPVVALGSSRVLNGLRPSLMPPGSPRFFNFGLTAHGPIQQHLALDRLLRDGVRPRAVTLEIFPAALVAGDRELELVPAFRHSAEDVVGLIRRGERHPRCAAEWLEARATPWYTHRFVLMSHWQPKWVAWDRRQDYVWTAVDADGWLPMPLPRDAKHIADLRATMTQTEGQTLASFRVEPASARAIRATLERCRTEGIAAAAVLMPEASWYRGFLTPHSEARLSEFAADVSRDFGVPIIDARAWCHDDDFRDGSHLIGPGVRTFSARFGREVARLFP